MAGIPPFQSDGLLPPGDYEVSFVELRQSLLVVGPRDADRCPNWDMMWRQYRVELYPHVAGLGCGICDKYGNELEFPSAFRQSRRDGRPRGIIKIRHGGQS